MRTLDLGLCLLVIASGAQSASYIQTDGTVVTRFSLVLGGDLACAGPNLEPDADPTGAFLFGTTYLGTTTGSAKYNAEIDFTDAYSGDYGNSPLFDPVAAGWTFVPERNTALLFTLGLAGLGMRWRRR